MKTKLFLLILLLLSFHTYAESPNEKFIQGKWGYGGQVDENFGWYMNVTYHRGHYAKDGYPPYKSEGKYKIIKDEGDNIILEHYDFSGDENGSPYQVTYQIDRDHDQLIINGAQPIAMKRIAR